MYNSQKLQTIQGSFHRQVAKQTVVHPYQRILPGKQEKRVIVICNHLDESTGSDALWRRANPKPLHTVYVHLHNIFGITI